MGVAASGCRTGAVLREERTASSTASSALADLSDDVEAERLARAHAHYGVGVIHDLNNEPDEALKEYEQAALADPSDETLVLEVSRRFLQISQPERALEIVSRAAEQPGASGNILARKGLISAQLGRRKEAIEANRAAIERAPDSLAGYQNLFVLHLQSKEYPEAFAILEQASRQTNAAPEFLIGLADLCRNLGLQSPALRDSARTNALAALTRVESLPLTNAPLKFALAEQWQQLGESDKAAQAYLALLKELPDMPGFRDRIHARLSEIYLRAQDHKRAVEQLEALVRNDPTNPLLHYFLGAIAMEERKPAEAVGHFRRTLLLKPDFEQVYYDLANAQISADQTSDALATLDEVRKKFSESFISEFLRAVAFSRQKAYDEAVRHFTAAEVIAKATEPSRLNHFFYFQFGAASERRGDFAEAEKLFSKCLELSPEFVDAMNYLGYMWAERGTNLVQAKALIEKAVKAEPKNAAFLDSMAWVLFQMEQPKEALTWMLQAVELTEEPDATVYDHLGDIYAALGEHAKARDAWEKSLGVEEKAAVRRKLEAVEKKPE